jgi:DNA-binding CsgD family transcriptional regulator
MQIKQVIFTDREVDVASCILNIRGAKKIANILLISPRTVETHTKNILIKINKNSREDIIDFIEKSDQLNFIKDHYLNLLVVNAFEQQLRRFAYLTKSHKLSFIILCTDKESKEKDVKLLSNHLKIAGFKITLQIFNTSAKQVLILKEGSAIQTDKHIINFSSKEQYFRDIFQMLKGLISDIDFRHLSNNFQILRDTILSSKTRNINELLHNSNSSPDSIFPYLTQKFKFNIEIEAILKTRINKVLIP